MVATMVQNSALFVLYLPGGTGTFGADLRGLREKEKNDARLRKYSVLISVNHQTPFS
jgi:hypothetical protein